MAKNSGSNNSMNSKLPEEAKTKKSKTTSQKRSTSEKLSSMEKFKMEAASEVGVNLKKGYNGNLTAKEAGAIGGRMVKKMIDSYKKSHK